MTTPDETRLQTVLADLKNQFGNDVPEPAEAESYYEQLVADARKKKSLCRYIGQAHLLPGMSWARLESILADMGIDDWNNYDLPALEAVVNRINTEAE